jgi:hypothetical protein
LSPDGVLMPPLNKPVRVGLRNPRTTPNGMDRNRKTTRVVCSCRLLPW